MRHLHAAGLAVSALQGTRHAVAQLEVGIRHVCAQSQLKVAPVDRRRVVLELADDRHVISVSGGRDLADGGGASRAAEFDDPTARPTPPDGLQQPGGKRSRARPALVRVEQHAAAGVRALRPGQRRPAAGPAPPAAAQQSGVVAEDSASRATAVLVVEQLDHERWTDARRTVRQLVDWTRSTVNKVSYDC